MSIRDTLAVITVAADSLRPWLDTWTVTRTPAADTHLADLMDDVLCEYEITDLSLGFYSEYHATAELVDWLLTDVRDRVTDSVSTTRISFTTSSSGSALQLASQPTRFTTTTSELLGSVSAGR
ncbi:hypothetical protein [Streptomyces sp. CB02488]|uniref:hypothetical protein n=1 Tax=Streptomyces sp. CB02488 TaxID=1703920 RepID=UPI0009399D43|nr:hypothetical protein [Streptomyces sp. CB02488]